MISRKRISAALGLLVATIAAPAFAQNAAPSANQQTADAIAASIRSNPELSRSRIAIETRDGTAILVGNMASPVLKSEALRLASQTPGVVNVVDRLRIVGDGPVRTVQYQPTQVAMGGLFHGGHSTPAMGGDMVSGPMEGGMVSGPGAAAPTYDGPMPEGSAGMTGPAQAAQPGMPNYAWPSYAPYPNFSAVGYPTAYPWQAWPNIGPFHPYPEVPLDWRAVTLRWDDGIWWLDFRKHYTRPFFTPYPFGLFAY